jgi:hypothetical protein
MTRGFFGNDRDISEVMEAREDLSAPRPAEFKGQLCDQTLQSGRTNMRLMSL